MHTNGRAADGPDTSVPEPPEPTPPAEARRDRPPVETPFVAFGPETAVRPAHPG